MTRKIEAHIRANGHEGYIVEISAPHLGPARVPVKECKPDMDRHTSQRYAMASARVEAQAYRDGFNTCVKVVADMIGSTATDTTAQLYPAPVTLYVGQRVIDTAIPTDSPGHGQVFVIRELMPGGRATIANEYRSITNVKTSYLKPADEPV